MAAPKCWYDEQCQHRLAASQSFVWGTGWVWSILNAPYPAGGHAVWTYRTRLPASTLDPNFGQL